MRVPGSGVTTAGPGSLRSLLVPFVVLIPAILLSAAATGSGHPGFPIVFTQLPAETARSASNDAPLFDCGDGARIVLLEPRGKRRVLTRGFASACDPEISFDGTRMLFAGRRDMADPWNVFEMDLATREVRQITRDLGNCRAPTYQGRLFTLDSPEPWSQITFVSDHAGEINEHGESPSTSLYTVRRDGSGVRRLTYNPSSDVDPTVLPDGRLLFSSWQRSTLDRGVAGRVALFTAQIDGLDYALFSGNEGRRVKTMPCVTTDRRVVFVETDDPQWDGSGTLGSVRLRRNLHSYEPVTTAVDGLFHSPSALPSGEILVSRRPDGDDGANHGLYTLDPRTGGIEKLFDDPDHHDVQAVAVTPRPRPDGRSTVVSEKFSTGVLYGLNVYDSDLGAAWVSTRTPLRLRVLEGIPRRGESRAEEPPVLRKRFLGEVAVEKDGSFNVEIPANTPVQLQLIDETGLALRSCSWIWVRNRETRGCIGCHEDGERTPENRFVQALAKPSIPLDLPPERRRTVDYRRDVLPILSSRCASTVCHGGGRAEPVLDGVASDGDAGDLAYQGLLAGFPFDGGDGPALGKYVHPGRARTSPLVWHVYGANTARPWDEGPRTVPAPMPFAGAGLTDEEKRVLAEWIDLGAPRGSSTPVTEP